MPNPSVPAAAEGVSSVYDPLLDIIRAYKSGLADFKANHPRDDDKAISAYADATYSPHLAALYRWDGPARTRDGAIAALRLSIEDAGGVAGCDGADRMVRAAIGFLEGQKGESGGSGPIKVMDVRQVEFLQAEDLVYECAHLVRLVYNAIEGLQLDDDLKSLSAGIYVIERKLHDAAELFELAKRAPDSAKR